jgi:hypothetical protein
LVVPAGADAGECRGLSAELAEADTRVEETETQLRKVSAQIERLQAGVMEQARVAPKAGALAPFVQRVASLAEECNLQIVRVLPQPVQAADGYLIGDVRFTGQGSSLDFVLLLDRLARENPYYALRDFSIVRPRGAADAHCQLSWTLRLHMLGEGAFADAGEAP